jgi:hypothetical protein
VSEAQTTCPKCGTDQPAGDACRRCGLIYANWQGGEGDGYTGIAGELWAKCEEQWDDAPRHDTFLLFCRREGSLSYAAGRYRAALKTRGAEDPVATKRLAEVVKLAEFAAQAEMAKDSPRKKGSRGPLRSATVLVAGAVFLLACAVAFFFFMKMIR